MKVEVKKRKKDRNISILISILLLFSLICNFPLFPKILIPGEAENGNIPEAWHNSSSLTVSVMAFRPQIVWYDLQYWNYSSGWESRLNQQIDVNNSARYRFIVNITSYQGWDDIEYINISAWHDLGDDSSTYNQTRGSNINMLFLYENTTNTGDTATFNMPWPKNEVTFTDHSEEVVVNSFTDWVGAESRNISFEFIPSYQLRYAPGPNNGWDTSSGVLMACTNRSFINNPWSWNFNITVTDRGKNNSDIPLTGWISDEFGVYSYSEIVSAGDPAIYGEPGGNYSVNDNMGSGSSGNITIVTRSNGNYSLSANLSDLTHVSAPFSTISNESVWLRGGNRSSFANFSKGANNNPVYLYGGGYNSMPNYQPAENNETNKTTANVEYKCEIDFGLEPGIYTSTIYYNLRTEL